MTATPDPRQDRPLKQEQDAERSRPLGSGDLPHDVLGEIVSETAASLAAPEQVDPALRSAMLQVARQYAGQPMTLDPAGSALLEAVLSHQFPFLAAQPKLLARTARAVANSLLADPAARLRVEHLWARLAEDAG